MGWLLTLGFSLVPAHGGIISFSGSVQSISPPASIVSNVGLESDTAAFLFSERTGLTLGSLVNVNISAPGVYTANAGLTPGSISAGTRVNSYYVHTDPVGTPTVGFSFAGSITFDTPILGVIILDPEIAASDAALGAIGTVYGGGRQVELNGPGESITVSADRRTISFTSGSGPGSDDFRILTSDVPEPSMVFLLGGILGLGLRARHRRHRLES